MEAIWKEVKTAIKDRVPIHSFRMWIEPLELTKGENGNWILCCPNFFYRKRLVERFNEVIESELSKVLGHPCRLSYEINNRSAASSAKDEGERQMLLPNANARPHSGRLLRRDFTFEHFVVGGNNDFAYSASLALASC